MRPVLSIEEMREVARAATASVPVERLIERAGTAVAREAAAMLDGGYGCRVIVVAGPGNNGADGRVAARLLERRGAKVEVLEAGEAREVLPPADLVVDAAFGTGFRGEYKMPAPTGAPVLSVDVPSGLDADTGECCEEAVRADRTVTMGALKPGLLLGAGRERAGQVLVRRVGLPVPPPEQCRMCLIEDRDVADLVPERGPEWHKWRTALAVVAGSPGMFGAPSFVARAAARAGAGMVRLGIPGAGPSDLPVSEAVSASLPLEGFDEAALESAARCKALVVGPGLGTDERTVAAVRRIVAKADVPVLVDADGLTALGDVESAARLISERSASTVLTPHDGEFARLAGKSPGRARIAAVLELASALGAVVLLKGSTTIVADEAGRVLLASSGSSRLATAGTGDVLSGVLGAFLARGMSGIEAAGVAAHVHGRAAELGPFEGLIAPDLPELISRVLSSALGSTRAC
ncbi:MAG: NAD(P)H-hydrate dehydratase [Acidimicrobiales bacterium]